MNGNKRRYVVSIWESTTQQIFYIKSWGNNFLSPLGTEKEFPPLPLSATFPALFGGSMAK